jgi:DNA-binding NarL/FixJ family response regulator
MIKVLITDDHPVVRRGIRQILEDDENISLIMEAENGTDLINTLKEHQFDVVLLDISLPGRSGLDLISIIKKTKHAPAVLILSIHSEEMYALRALQSGAAGYLTKTSAPEELLSAIHKVSRGERYISAFLAEKLADNFLFKTEKPLLQSLSSREMEVLNLYADGKSVVQISKVLNLSPKTISTYRVRLLEKLKLSTTGDLIRYAIIESNTGQK